MSKRKMEKHAQESVSFREAMSAEALYESMWKCRRGKMWKASVARYVLHGIEETLKLEDELRREVYKPRKPRRFMLYYPKVRPCSSTHIRDRIVQRSLNDKVIYPAMTKSFIYDNMACQIGKGTTRAMDRLNMFLRKAWLENGRKVKGLSVLQMDIEGYYRTMRHCDAQKCFERHLDEETVRYAMSWLQRQYPYDVGYEPGSQMVQILGISLLNPLDHFIKEQMHAKFYLRYMDDLSVIGKDTELLQWQRNRIANELNRRFDMSLHKKKTRIYPLSEGIRILGFRFKITDKGKVLRLINPENVKHERKKLRRMAKLVQSGRITKEKMEECYNSWKAHAKLGNSCRLLKRMDAYYQNLLRERKEQNHGNTTANRQYFGAAS